MPAAIESSEEFVVNAPLERCWVFFCNLSNIGGCIPGCESVTLIDDKSASFKVKLKVGYLSRSFDLTAKITKAVPMSEISFGGEGSDAEISGSLSFSPTAQSSSTSVKYLVEIRPVSVAGKTAAAMIGKDVARKQASEFAACVKAKLDNVP